jgi:ribosomal protein L40E
MERKRIKRRKLKVCSSCGAQNPLDAKQCKGCKKERFEPAWVKAKRLINRQFSVQITQSNPDFGDISDRITLSKWWPGGRSTLHIPNASQWKEIVKIIDSDLGPLLGWAKAKEFVKEARKREKAAKLIKKDLSNLLSEQPAFLKDLIAAVDPKKIGHGDFNSFVETLGEISDVFTNTNAGFREAFLRVVKKLPTQKQRALEDLDLLLQGWSLHVITNVAQQVRSRIETVELFEKQVNDDRTYEIIGDNSIHRILERAMWLVDERYWLLHSNRTLLNSIAKEMQKRDKKRYGKKRPDFVCGSYGQRLIILELKRPSHTLEVGDLNQLEQYMIVAENYTTFRSYEAYLVGQRIDEDLKRTMRHRSSSFKILTYADLIDETRKRYHEFLETLQ